MSQPHRSNLGQSVAKLPQVATTVLNNRRYRAPLVLAIVVLTCLIVIGFFATHPAYLQQLHHVRPTVILAVIALNIPAMVALAWAYDAMLRLCGTRMPTKENVLLTAYSSIGNFFGPLQSGPGIRAAYVKLRHGVRIRDYILATFMYYGFFASINALFLMAGVRPWWQTIIALLGAVVISVAVIWVGFHKTPKRVPQRQRLGLRADLLASLAFATLLQVCFIASYYFVELRAVNPSISVGQAISYTGAANFSLFVSITPDAVGFREAFLVFSQHIHHISTGDILAANIIDRCSYLLFLLLLFVFVASVHAKDRLRVKNWRQVE